LAERGSAFQGSIALGFAHGGSIGSTNSPSRGSHGPGPTAIVTRRDSAIGQASGARHLTIRSSSILSGASVCPPPEDTPASRRPEKIRGRITQGRVVGIYIAPDPRSMQPVTRELRLPVRRTRWRGRRGHRRQGRGGAVGRGRRLRAGDQPDADRLRRRDGQPPRSGAPARAAAGGENERGGAGPARGADRARPRRDEPRGAAHSRGGRGAERSREGRRLGTAAGRIHEVGA
jgi:hypothetical protein